MTTATRVPYVLRYRIFRGRKWFIPLKKQSLGLTRPVFNSVYKCPAAKLQLLTVRSWYLYIYKHSQVSGMNHRWKSMEETFFFCRILKLLKNINTQNWGSSRKRTLFFPNFQMTNVCKVLYYNMEFLQQERFSTWQ